MVLLKEWLREQQIASLGWTKCANMKPKEIVLKPTIYRSFADLQSLAKAGRKAASQEATQKPPPPKASEPEALTDGELFEQSMQDVVALGWSDVPVLPAEPIEIPNPRQSEDDGLKALVDFVEGRVPIDLRVSGEYVEGTPDPRGRRLLEGLRTGRFAVEAHLDLHGLSLSAARTLLEEFIRSSLYQGHGCVRVVHGRGHHSAEEKPILKENVQKWLCSRRMSRHILAYTSASLQDGGGGALYVLLKK
jgi:DNA-nicking Smr family endonuclease